MNRLKSICRVQGLTPHTSTGRCPYELVKLGPLPSLFPKLSTASRQLARSERTAVQQSAGRLRKVRSFEEGQDVIVFNNRTQLSSHGKIIEILGKNTYLVDCGEGQKTCQVI